MFPSEKLDSLNKARGKVLSAHNEDDDAKGIIHLVRRTNEMKQQLEQVKTFQMKRTFNNTLLPNSGKVDKKYQVGLLISIVIDRAGDIKMMMNSSPKVREDIASAFNSLM